MPLCMRKRSRDQSASGRLTRELSVGNRVAVLNGRQYPGFGSGDRGTVVRVNAEAQNCDVLFDTGSMPVQVALRHLRHLSLDRSAAPPNGIAATPVQGQASCPSCGNHYMDDSNFCRKCGLPRHKVWHGQPASRANELVSEPASQRLTFQTRLAVWQARADGASDVQQPFEQPQTGGTASEWSELSSLAFELDDKEGTAGSILSDTVRRALLRRDEESASGPVARRRRGDRR